MKKLSTLIAFALLFSNVNFAQLNTSYNSDANLIANFLLGTGVNISNASITCDTAAIGFFNNGITTNLGINEGLALSSGNISDLPGPNNSSVKTTNFGTPGDLHLDSIETTFSITNDACIFEFDVESVLTNYDTIAFNYVFGSEEYLEFVNSFNDIFAFFVSGPNPNGGNYVNENVALIPNSNLPVSINNVNDAVNSQYYIDNGDGDPFGSPQYTDSTVLQFDGFTTVLEAKFAVIPNQTYHLKMAVADVGDSSLDSGVFIEAGSIFAKLGTVNFEDNVLQNIENLKIVANILNYQNYNEKAVLNVLDLNGKILKSVNVKAQENIELNLSNLKENVYLVNVVTNEKSITQKFINK